VIRTRRLAPVVVLALAAAACAHRSHTVPEGRGRTLVALLPDPDSGAVGRAIVSNLAGSVELAEARASTVVAGRAAPTPVKTLSEGEAGSLFSDVLASLPSASQHFVLNFEFDSDELTADSKALLPQVLNAVKGHPVPEVQVIGHTDTVGTPASNITLGMRRAEMIRKQLIDIGLDPTLIEIVSHGEADLLVQTADDVPEPRNRRVEITVR
jgi:outer membrane protein OmpA-like peptidoglycan-associated protein